jgi:hypothetical protein
MLSNITTDGRKGLCTDCTRRRRRDHRGGRPWLARIQGYLFSKPLDPEALAEELLHRPEALPV